MTRISYDSCTSARPNKSALLHARTSFFSFFLLSSHPSDATARFAPSYMQTHQNFSIFGSISTTIRKWKLETRIGYENATNFIC